MGGRDKKNGVERKFEEVRGLVRKCLNTQMR
jgi:hypothetical protein